MLAQRLGGVLTASWLVSAGCRQGGRNIAMPKLEGFGKDLGKKLH
jgi:hypothetical protein